MVTRSAVMLAALTTKTPAFCFPFTAGGRCIRTHGNALSTRVTRLLAVGTEVQPLPDLCSEAVSDTSHVKSSFLQTLVERGFYHQCTNVEGLDNKLSSGEVVKAYLGFDATADRYILYVVSGC